MIGYNSERRLNVTPVVRYIRMVMFRGFIVCLSGGEKFEVRENSWGRENAFGLYHPLILSGLFQQVFNWVDAFIVGNVEGELALAGIGATTSIYNLFVTVITGFTSGLSVLTAQQFGMEKKKKSALFCPPTPFS